VFCSKGCRSAFHGEARQLGYRMVNAPGLRPDRRDQARHAPPVSFWRSGIDVATGRRVHISIISPSHFAGYLASDEHGATKTTQSNPTEPAQ